MPGMSYSQCFHRVGMQELSFVYGNEARENVGNNVLQPSINKIVVSKGSLIRRNASCRNLRWLQTLNSAATETG